VQAAICSAIKQKKAIEESGETVVSSDSSAPALAPVLTRHDLESGCGAEILLVEDNEVNQKLACALLTRWGMVYSVAGNGAVALDILKQRSFDIILMDCQMPVMDGFEASSRIRALDDEHARTTPILAMTANAMEGDREKCLAAGMDDYISKPISPSILKEAIARLARRSEKKESAMPMYDYKSSMSAAEAETIEIIAEPFMDSMSNDFNALRKAIGDARWQDASRLAHSAKGLFMTFEAVPMVETFRAMESLFMGGIPDPMRAEALLEKAEGAWPFFVKDLKEYLSERSKRAH
jgi:CheY-like chemotaxis protein